MDILDERSRLQVNIIEWCDNYGREDINKWLSTTEGQQPYVDSQQEKINTMTRYERENCGTGKIEDLLFQDSAREFWRYEGLTKGEVRGYLTRHCAGFLTQATIMKAVERQEGYTLQFVWDKLSQECGFELIYDEPPSNESLCEILTRCHDDDRGVYQHPIIRWNEYNTTFELQCRLTTYGNCPECYAALPLGCPCNDCKVERRDDVQSSREIYFFPSEETSIVYPNWQQLEDSNRHRADPVELASFHRATCKVFFDENHFTPGDDFINYRCTRSLRFATKTIGQVVHQDKLWGHKDFRKRHIRRRLRKMIGVPRQELHQFYQALDLSWMGKDYMDRASLTDILTRERLGDRVFLDQMASDNEGQGYYSSDSMDEEKFDTRYKALREQRQLTAEEEEETKQLDLQYM